MPGEHGIVEYVVVFIGYGFFVVAGLYGIYILFKFWMSFAEGINEASPKPKGFEVKTITGQQPVSEIERDQNHG